MAARKKAFTPIDIDQAVADAAAAVRSSGACAIAKLGVPKARRGEVIDRLRDIGFEVTKSNVRLPLLDQLAAALATGAFLPLRSLNAQLAAATPAESKSAALELVRAGRAHIVARAGAPTLVPLASAVLEPEALARLASALDVALKAIRKSARGKTALLRDDVVALLAPLGSVGSAHGTRPADGDRVSPSPSPPARRSTAIDPARVRAAVVAAVEPGLGLAFVPDVVRTLAPGSSIAEAIFALRAAAEQGLLELRPESGLGRLSSEERALCVRGRGDVLLSWARLTEVPRP